MKLFGGGGNEFSGAAKIKGETLSSIRSKLEFILNPTAFLTSDGLDFCVENNGMQLKLKK